MGFLKLGGIASGLDTETLIKQLMQIERRPVTLLEQRVSTLTTKANAWRDLNGRLLTLQNRVNDLRSLGASTWTAKKTTVADATVLTASASSSATPGTYSVQVVKRAVSTTWEGNNNTISDPDADLNQSGTLVVNSSGANNGETFTISATDSLNEIARNINADSSRLGFTASVIQKNPGDYRLVLTGNTGTNNDFYLTDSVGTAGAWLQITDATGTKVSTAANAEIEVNGITVTASGNSVQDAIPGVTLNLLKEGTGTTVTVSKDYQKAIDAAKAFVDQYNSVLDFAASLTKYDDKTKKGGTLIGESTVLNLRSRMSTMIQDPVATLPADLNSLAMVGITTEAYSADKGVSGKLKFDQAKFTEALDKDADSVMKLFTLNDGTNKGVAQKLYETLFDYTRFGGFILNQAKNLESTITQTNERIKNYDTVILAQREKRLRDQFIAMEKAMSMFQNQGNWLTQQIQSLQPTKK